MYDITRQEASEILNLSTRTIDRYIKSWTFRTEKKWKIVYIHKQDVENLSKQTTWNQEVITNYKPEESKSGVKWDSKEISKKDTQADLGFIFEKLRNEIREKDQEIMTLYGRNVILKHKLEKSIPLEEFNRSQYLLKESNMTIQNELSSAKLELDDTKIQLKSEVKINYMLIVIAIILILLVLFLWLASI